VVSLSEVALVLRRSPVSWGSQCGPAPPSTLNRRGEVEGVVGALVFLQVYFNQDLNSRDSLPDVPPGPDSQGRGAAPGAVGAHAQRRSHPRSSHGQGVLPAPAAFSLHGGSAGSLQPAG